MSGPVFIDVIHAGAHCSVQDLGRHGWRHLGVACAGALDPAQAALANRLVGNPADAAVLEIAMSGPVLAFAQPVRIALCGAEFAMRFESADGQVCAVPDGRPVILPAGTLRLGAVRPERGTAAVGGLGGGLRAWLAVAGGIDVPQVLGSRSTDLRGGFGGFDGRCLRAGDRLPLGPAPACEAQRMQAPAWWVSLRDRREGSALAPIRYVPSPLALSNALTDALDARAWRVSPRSDRQGLRCEGDGIGCTLPEQVSAPVAPGAIQLPPDGRPIVLLADAQTIGGYPRLGYVIAADLPRLAQARPGEALRFTAVGRGQAAAANRKYRGEIARLHWAVDLALAREPSRPHR